jgi:uncharacterized repeat protein (TIGR03803 family)
MPNECSYGKLKTLNPLRRWKLACAIFLFCAAAAIAAPAQTFTNLLSFDGSDGIGPHYGHLVQGIDGDFYGMTDDGGSGGCGTVFKITPQGALTTLFNFQSDDNGCNPDGGLMLATGGDIYGSTTNAGSSGGGTIFRVSPSGTLTTIHEFNYTDGGNTNSALAEGVYGIFYGTTVNGGHAISCCDGGGVIFKMTSAGVYTVLHFFDFTDGWDPKDAPLTQATDGSFYGVTAGGGDSACSHGCGTVFKIGPQGAFTVLHNFNGTDGYSLVGGVVQATDGNLYGTTSAGGTHGEGTVFKLAPSGALTTLYSFSGTDGAQPWGRLVQATDGNFYGTTYGGGANGDGTVFEMTPAGKLTTLHNFDGTDGAEINSGLSQATNGTFYGITAGGGASGDGTIFSLSVGLGPFVSFIRNSGKVGLKTVEILGQGFTGTTDVSFNGTHATFTVVSDTYLTATVPAGATTGKINVTTPSGTLTSNQNFRVTPQIFSFSPTSGPPGTKVTITGESFTQTAAVTLAYKYPLTYTVNSDTQITATIPTSATTGEISVRGPGGVAHTTAKFTVTQ